MKDGWQVCLSENRSLQLSSDRHPVYVHEVVFETKINNILWICFVKYVENLVRSHSVIYIDWLDDFHVLSIDKGPEFWTKWSIFKNFRNNSKSKLLT